MKVAYVISMVKGGVPAFTYREIDVLSSNGYQIALCPLTYKIGPYMPKSEWPIFRFNFVKLLISQIIMFFTQPIKYLSLFALSLRMKTLREFAIGMCFSRDMERWGAEHIHCHFGDSKLYTGYYCSIWLNLPMTVTVHAYEIHSNPNDKMFKLAIERCSKIVVQSHFNKNLVIQNFGVREDKIALIRAHGDMSGSCGSNSLKLLMVAEFREKKGHQILISAVKKLDRENITLWIVGDGPLNVRGMAVEAGIENQTVFLGMVGKDLLNILYDSCDIFVLPSRTAKDGDSEGIPAVLMEAMSHAKPVISTKHAGIPELVEDILVEENDVDALADAIARLADDPGIRSQMGKRNYNIIKSKYSDQAVLQLGELYKSSVL